MKKKTEINYLEKIPCRKDSINWTSDEKGIVTLEIENKGPFNFIAQKLLKKPRISYVHLDENGSFIWPLIDGETNIIDLGIKVREHFGEAAEPLYPRLSKFFEILESYHFVDMK
jgi:hypothetical protein